MGTKRKSEDDVNEHGPTTASPSKKAKNTWSDAELKALWKGIHGVSKKNVATFMEIPELKASSRTVANVHNKLDSIFKDLMGEKGGKTPKKEEE